MKDESRKKMSDAKCDRVIYCWAHGEVRATWRSLCRMYGLNSGSLHRVIQGAVDQHKGWRLVGGMSERTWIHPQHGVFKGTRAEFREAFKLGRNGVAGVYSGRLSSHCGWSIVSGDGPGPSS